MPPDLQQQEGSAVAESACALSSDEKEQSPTDQCMKGLLLSVSEGEESPVANHHHREGQVRPANQNLDCRDCCARAVWILRDGTHSHAEVARQKRESLLDALRRGPGECLIAAWAVLLLRDAVQPVVDHRVYSPNEEAVVAL